MSSRLRNQPSICWFRFLDLLSSVNLVTITNGAGLDGQLVQSVPFSIEGIFPDLICAVDLKTVSQFVASVFGIPLRTVASSNLVFH